MIACSAAHASNGSHIAPGCPLFSQLQKSLDDLFGMDPPVFMELSSSHEWKEGGDLDEDSEKENLKESKSV